MQNELTKALPQESILHDYLVSRSITETPVSYDLMCGMSALALSLKRSVWFSQEEWNVYPVISVLLVGPSGIGKNTAISGAKKLVELLGIKSVDGKTIEMIQDQLGKLGRPATGLIVAEEFAALVGGKDYQQGLVTGLTDLLDTKDYFDISLKSTGVRKILEPTLGLIAGSTAEWLHELPKETMQGGFYGRFIVLCETHSKRSVSVISMLPPEERRAAAEAKLRFNEAVVLCRDKMYGAGELKLTPAAYKLYDHWYTARHSYFSTIAQAYAQRARDHALRCAMLSAVSCFRTQLTEADVHFGVSLINHVSKTIDNALGNVHKETILAGKILDMLPMTTQQITFQLMKLYKSREIKDALALLHDSGQVAYNSALGVLARKGN